MSNATASKPKPPASGSKGRADFALLVESPSARAVLNAAGIFTIADAKAMGMEKIVEIPDLGEGTIEILRRELSKESAPSAPKSPKSNIKPVEEGPHPLLLHSPFAEYRFPLKKARKSFDVNTGETALQHPLWVEFSDHHARVTSKMWFLRIHNSDEDKALADIAAGKPWRQQCAAWLRSLNGFPRSFAIQSD